MTKQDTLPPLNYVPLHEFAQLHGVDYNKLCKAVLESVLAVAPQPDHADHVPEIAARLRHVAELAGCSEAVPEQDATAVGAIFSVLGNIRRALERQAQGVPAGTKFFSYGSDAGFDMHYTEAAAMEAAQSDIDAYREEAGDGWPEEVEQVCWGVVLGRAQEVDQGPAPEGSDFDRCVDYTLAAAPQAEPPQKTCLVSGACKHGSWCTETYCQEHCQFVKAEPQPERGPLTDGQQFCYCGDEISLQGVSGGAAPEGLYGSVTLKVGGEFARYSRQAQQAQGVQKGFAAKLAGFIEREARDFASERFGDPAQESGFMDGLQHALSMLAAAPQAEPQTPEPSEERRQLLHLLDDIVEEAEQDGATYYRIRDGKDILFSNMVGACARLLAQPEREPVAWLWKNTATGRTRIVTKDSVITADATWEVVCPLIKGRK